MKHKFPNITASNITYNPSFKDLRLFSEDLEQKTEYGSPNYISKIKSRSSSKTLNNIDGTFNKEDETQVSLATEKIFTEEFVCMDRKIGRHPNLNFTCRLFVPKKYSRIALSWATLLEPSSGEDPDFYTVHIPEWEAVRIRIFPEDGVTYVLGSDYTGEAKKSFLRLFMYNAKKRDGLGLHAGSKHVNIETPSGISQIGQMFLGLSATGKTTLTCDGFGLKGNESANLVQDDVCALFSDGSSAGSEGGGLYIKTIGLSEKDHPEIYGATTCENAVIENVSVGKLGEVDFEDGSLTENGRASILRSDLPNATDYIDLEQTHQIFFITRNPLMPPVARLTSEEAAAAFMLGESIETSAGDPTRAGEPIRVVGTNPFIIGPEGEEGNRFLDLIQNAGIECFVINTGEVGSENPKSVRIEHSVSILREIAKGNIEWELDDNIGLEIPVEVPGMDIKEFYPPDYFKNYNEILGYLKKERKEYLLKFPTLQEKLTVTKLSS
jgi:phosphoenolpyruvate carboxykinase (ATP)